MRSMKDVEVPDVTTSMGDGLERTQPKTRAGSNKLAATTPNPNAELRLSAYLGFDPFRISLSCSCSDYSGQVVDSPARVGGIKASG